MRQIILILLFLTAALFCAPRTCVVAKDSKGSGTPLRAPLAIIFTCDTEGYLEPCG